MDPSFLTIQKMKACFANINSLFRQIEIIYLLVILHTWKIEFLQDISQFNEYKSKKYNMQQITDYSIYLTVYSV